jgi:hypothetical protein
MTAKWNKSAPPKDRQFLAFARKSGLPETVDAVRIVAEWHVSTESFRPVKVAGDKETGAELIVLRWTELPDPPTT